MRARPGPANIMDLDVSHETSLRWFPWKRPCDQVWVTISSGIRAASEIGTIRRGFVSSPPVSRHRLVSAWKLGPPALPFASLSSRSRSSGANADVTSSSMRPRYSSWSLPASSSASRWSLATDSREGDGWWDIRNVTLERSSRCSKC